MRESSRSHWTPMSSYKKKVKMEVEGVPRCIASSRVGRNDRLGGGCDNKESSEKERGQEVEGSQ